MVKGKFGKISQNIVKMILVKVMKDIIGRLGNYSISLVVKQALLNWGYELVNNY